MQSAYNLTHELLAISPDYNPRAEISLQFYKLEQEKAEKLRHNTKEKEPEVKTEELLTNTTTDKEHDGNKVCDSNNLALLLEL